MFNVALKRKKPAATDGPLTPGQAGQQTAAAKDPLNTKRDREAARSRLKSAASREIGPLPPILNPDRRESCKNNFGLFCKTYFPQSFPLPFSPDHLKAIEKLERAVIHGALFAFAMPRGSGKSTLTVTAAIWSLVYGYRRFVCLVGATEAHAEQLLATIKAGLAGSDTLAADFPEVCIPIRALENDARRATGQIVNGRKTAIIWKNKKVTLPTVEGSLCSGSVLSVAGITGRVRGQNHTLPSGEVIRPELVIIDDPQTRDSAWSDPQCEKRRGIVAGDVLGLGGPGKKIAAVMPCTVIRKGDMADRILDRQHSPDWQGERSKMLYSLPSNEKLWEQYAQLRADSLRADGNGSEATEFYRQHREEMDAGAKPAWPERYNPDELSAIQHAMNLKLRDEEAWYAEAQNEPREHKPDVTQLTAEQICTKLNGLTRGQLPTETAVKITAFIDVQEALLFWMVCAWSVEDLDGWIIDYGTYPEQPKRYFQLRTASPTLSSTFPGLSIEAVIRKGLDSLVPQLMARKFGPGEGGQSIDKLLIDQGYKQPVIHGFIRAFGRSNVIPARGVGIGAAAKPMSEYKRQPGEILGSNWMMPKPQPGELRHVRHDTNHWKTFVHSRLALAAGTKGAITLFGTAQQNQQHRLLAEHLTAEFGTPTEGHGRQLIEWRLRPARPDNHWFDGLVGCAVAASMEGCGKSLEGRPSVKKRRPSHREAVYLT